VHQAKARTRAALCKGALDLSHDPHRAKRREAATKTHGDVCRKRLTETLPRRVGQARMRPRLPAGTRPATAPAAGSGQGERELSVTSRHWPQS
jgi:hypothetical protein